MIEDLLDALFQTDAVVGYTMRGLCKALPQLSRSTLAGLLKTPPTIFMKEHKIGVIRLKVDRTTKNFFYSLVRFPNLSTLQLALKPEVIQRLYYEDDQ